MHSCKKNVLYCRGAEALSHPHRGMTKDKDLFSFIQYSKQVSILGAWKQFVIIL